MDRPSVISRADTTRGRLYSPDWTSRATASSSPENSNCPVMQYSIAMPSSTRPEPRQLKIRYRMAATTERPLSLAATAMQAVTAAISTNT